MLWAWVSCVAAIVAFQFAIATGGSKADHGVSSPFARRNHLHGKRRAQHVATGSMIYTATSVFSTTVAAALLFGCAAVFYVLHGLRQRYPTINKVYLEQFGALLRREEISAAALPGAFYFLAGCGAVVVLFPYDIARLAILHLSVGDPAAAVVGILYGRKRSWHQGKSLEGSAGCFLASSTASLVALSWESNLSSDAVLLSTAAFAGGCAAVAEGINLWGWDDNLTLPILSALFMHSGRRMLGII